MSRTPLPEWMGSFPDNRYRDAGNRAVDDPGKQHPTQTEPPRFLYPDSQGYVPSGMNPMHLGFVFEEASRDGYADNRYSLASGSYVSPAQHTVQRSFIPKNVDYSGPSNSYFETSSQGRGSISSTGRANDVESLYSSSSTTFPSPIHSDRSTALIPTSLSIAKHPAQQPQRQSVSGVPSGFERLLHHSPTPSPPPRRPSTASRYHLYIRQQPLAARACGAGDRDRRPVDPPPIIQMLLTDFDPFSEEEKEALQDPRFSVGCLLFPVPPNAHQAGDGTSRHTQNPSHESNQGQSTPLLSGKAFVSPFYVDADPDPATAPPHPTSETDLLRRMPSNLAGLEQPATFFIFSDLSIRTAGTYQLQFRLMNWGHVEDTGQSMPILAEVWSEPFRVFPAKDFPGMRDSSPLTEGLKELGFVELKTRGKGKGKGRKR
ncbi:velvet factor-domain-containing protein [Aspergillus avenaceus]|uniref:Velvet factor-domain-containing protein n=1 Tax=Aspergillus avenaceus TaxID=36643 RepID=A0A5N6TRM9_ASPAV|nr:velvet factor-domain-containing protein [Aspergillus avenaceus]